MQTKVFTNEEGFDRLAAEWNDLLGESVADTVFLTHEWQTIWWQHLGHGSPLLISFRDNDGRLLGLAPLFRYLNDDGQWVLSTVGCVAVSDYLDLIARRGYEKAVFVALLDLLEQPDAFDFTWDVVDLCNIRHSSPTLSLLVPMAAERGYQVKTQKQEVCPIVQLEGSWDDYLAALPGKQRRELRRKLRKATPLVGVEWYIAGPEHDLTVEVDKFLQLMALSHPDKAEFLQEDRRAFMQAIAHAAWETGWLELAFLTVNGEPAATMFDFVYNNQTLLYNSGLDAARFLRFSPGIVLTAHLIEHSIAQGRDLFDFLRGDEAYKYQLGGVDTTIHQLLIRR